MPARRFTVRLNPDDLTVSDFAAALTRPDKTDRPSGAEHHGAHDERQAARQRSEQAHSSRAAGATGGRSYAFRRS